MSVFSNKFEPESDWSVADLWGPKDFDSAHAVIQNALQKYNLRDWGFVIVRCTYRSQEKWDKFVALAQGHACDYFEECQMPAVHERLRWTIIEDAAALEGANVLETSRRFDDWAHRPGGPGVQERQGTEIPPRWRASYSPRYAFFLHVDEESLESVMEGPKEGPWGQERGYFCKLVDSRTVLLAEKEQGNESDILPAEEKDSEVGLVAEEDLHELRKRVRIDRLANVYAMLQYDMDFWYDLPMDDGDIVGAWTC